MQLSKSQKLAEPLYQHYAQMRAACPLLKRNRALNYHGADETWANFALVRHDAPAARKGRDLERFTPRVLVVACQDMARSMRASGRKYGITAVILGVTGAALVPFFPPVAGVLLGLGGVALALGLGKIGRATQQSRNAMQLRQQQAKLQPALDAWEARQQDLKHELYLKHGPSPLTHCIGPEADKLHEIRLRGWKEEVARAEAEREANGGVAPR